MLREPRKDHETTARGKQGAEQKGRFRIVKLDERIAPGNGKGSNASCGHAGTCHKCFGK
jgi:hypothetical protein